MAKFVKGESGNPGGRPKGEGEIREIARQHTDAAIRTLVRVMSNKKASHGAQVAAASALLDRGWGRPQQSIRAEGFDMGSAIQIISERLQRGQAAEQVSPQKLAS
jgi:hypothetical protein